jgi:hypothetical protein
MGERGLRKTFEVRSSNAFRHARTQLARRQRRGLCYGEKNRPDLREDDADVVYKLASRMKASGLAMISTGISSGKK